MEKNMHLSDGDGLPRYLFVEMSFVFFSSVVVRFWTFTLISHFHLKISNVIAGGGMLASAKTNKKEFDLANNIIIGGLVLQLLWFGLFVVIALIFHRRMMLAPTARSYQSDIKWRSYLHALYVASVLIILRNIFRLIEYCQGSSGYLLTTEVFVYCLDALPMFLVVAWFLWKYVGEVSGLLRTKQSYGLPMNEIWSIYCRIKLCWKDGFEEIFIWKCVRAALLLCLFGVFGRIRDVW